MIRAVARRELQRALVTPLAWVLLASTQLIVALAFLLALGELRAEPELARELGVTAHTVRGVYGFAAVWLLLVLPVLGMRALADDYRSGTIRLLRTSPISAWRIVTGKYLALLALGLVMTGLCAALPASLAVGTELDWGILGAGTAALAMLVAVYCAVAVATSSFTSQPATAAVAAIGLIMLLWLAHWAGTHGLPGAGFWLFVSPAGHLDRAFEGLLTTRGLASGLFWIVVMLGAATLRLWARGGTMIALRRRLTRPAAALGGAAAAALAGAAIVAGAVMGGSADLSADDRNTLSSASISLVEELEGGVELTAYAPRDERLRERIRDLVQRYRRYRPELSLSFVDTQAAPQTLRRLGVPGRWALAANLGERTEVCTEISEQCVSRALLRLTRTRQGWIAFLQGHGERPLDETTGSGLGHFRAELKAEGYRSRTLNLARSPKVPDNVRLVVVAGPQIPIPSGERALLAEYLRAGGNLLILAEPRRDNGLAALAQRLDVTLGEGVIVYPDYELLGTGHPATIPVVDHGSHPVARDLPGNTIFIRARPLQLADDSDWRSEPIARGLERSWAETGPLRGELRFDEADGDRPGPLLIGVALHRQREGGAEQRAAVLGDGDFLSNRYLRRGSNLELGLNLVSWLTASERQLTIPPDTRPDDRLTLRVGEMRVLAGLFGVALPVALAAAGIVTVRRRRR